MEQQQRGRGRARGRARGPPTGGAVPRPGPGPQPGSRPPQQARPGPQGAWGTPAPVQPPTVSAWGPPSQVQQQHQIRAPAPQPQAVSAGRATFRAGGDGSAPGREAEIAGQVIGAGGDPGAMMHSGRGAIRGRRTLTELATYYRTKPAELATKQGKF